MSKEVNSQASFGSFGIGGRQGVHYWTQEQVDDFVRWQSGTNSSLGAPSSQGLMFQQLNDWILGGFLGRTTGRAGSADGG